jgi:hypothetical protein
LGLIIFQNPKIGIPRQMASPIYKSPNIIVKKYFFIAPDILLKYEKNSGAPSPALPLSQLYIIRRVTANL